MKRIIAALLVLSMLAGLAACKKKTEEPAPEAEAAPAAETAPEPAEAPAAPFPDDIVGSWILVDSNDTELTEELFPGAKELGGTLEICTDGAVVWTVGATNGTGRIISAEGDDVSAELSRGPDGEMAPMAGLLERSNEALALYLNFGGVDLIWVHTLPDYSSQE